LSNIGRSEPKCVSAWHHPNPIWRKVMTDFESMCQFFSPEWTSMRVNPIALIAEFRLPFHDPTCSATVALKQSCINLITIQCVVASRIKRIGPHMPRHIEACYRCAHAVHIIPQVDEQCFLIQSTCFATNPIGRPIVRALRSNFERLLRSNALCDLLKSCQ